MKKIFVVVVLCCLCIVGIFGFDKKTKQSKASCVTSTAYPKVNPKAPSATFTYKSMEELYQNFSDLTRPQRISIFNKLSNDDKATIWITHLKTVKQNHKYNDRAINYINELIQSLETKGITIEKKKSVADLTFLFGSKEAAYEVVGRLGGKSGDTQKYHYTNFTQTHNCGCSPADDWCLGSPTSNECYCRTFNCEITDSGCGFLWLTACTGDCQGPACS